MQFIKIFNVLCYVSIFASFFGMFADIPFIKEHLLFYIYGRIFFSISSGILLILSKKQFNIDKLIYLYLLNMMLYSIHGQLFMPGYYLAYIEVLLCIGIFFPIDKTKFRLISIVSLFIMIFVIYFSRASYSKDPIQTQKFKLDAIIAVLITSIGTIGGHSFITLARKEKDILYNKFIDIGKNSAFILHDFKGMISTPLIYTKILKENIKQNDFQKADLNLDKLSKDLKEIELYAKEINKITLPNKGLAKETIKLSNIAISIKILLQKYLDNVDFKLENDGELTTDPSLLLKVLYNLTMNSINEFKKHNQSNCAITITYENRKIIYLDNGKGYPEHIIKNLNANKLNLDSSTGNSGLGLQIVAGIAESLNLKLKLFNNNGAGVEITL